MSGQRMGRGAPLQHAAAVLALVFLAAACSGPPGPTEGSAYEERVVLRLGAADFQSTAGAAHSPTEQLGNDTREVLVERRPLLVARLSALRLAQGENAVPVTLPEEVRDLPASAFRLSVLRLPDVLNRETVELLAGAEGNFSSMAEGWHLRRDHEAPGTAAIVVTASALDEGKQSNLRLESVRPTPRTLESRIFALARDSTIELGYALANPSAAPPGSRVRFSASLGCAGGAPRDVHERTLSVDEPADRGWHEASVRVAETAGACRLRLATAGSAHDLGDPVWAAPRIVRRTPLGEGPRHSVVLISLDTLRADHLSSYGYPRPTSPSIDRLLAARGTLFSDVSTTFPMTHVAHQSLFTSLYPASQPRLGYLPPEAQARTLAEAMRDAGFETAAFTEDALVSAAYGFSFGFDRFLERRAPPHKRARETFADGVRYLREHRTRRFFLFLHTYQVHAPFTPSDAYRPLFRDSQGAGAVGGDVPASHRTDFDDYDRGIRETDDLLAELLDELDRLGMSESTYVVLLSDHGEAFGEHGSAGHGYAPHQEQLHVPLIVRGPGVPAGRRVTTPASLVDVAPTLLELLGVAPLPQAQGRSLSAAIRDGDGNAPVVRPVYFQWAGEASRGVRFERWKFFETGRGSWLFDLATDPGERSPVAGQPSVLQVARDYLDRAAPGTASPPPAGAEEARGPVISEGTEKALRALGYLQ